MAWNLSLIHGIYLQTDVSGHVELSFYINAEKCLEEDIAMHVYTLSAMQANSIGWESKIQRKLDSKRFVHANQLPFKESAAEQDLIQIINATIQIQQTIVVLAENINKTSRLTLLYIFMQATLTLVLNTYNMVIFYVRVINDPKHVEFSLGMACLFYGYNFFRAAHEILVTVVIFSFVSGGISTTTRIVNQLNAYATTEALRNRLLQFAVYAHTNFCQFMIFDLYELNGAFIAGIISSTITYVVILTQYGLQFELEIDVPANETVNKALQV